MTGAPPLSKPRWLFVTPQIPRPDHASGDRRFFEIIAAMSTRVAIDVLVQKPETPANAPYAERLRALGVNVVGYGLRAGMETLLRRVYDAVFFEFYHSANPLLRTVRSLQPHALVVVDSVDIHYNREREGALLGRLSHEQADLTEAEELAVYRQADITIVVSEAERDLLESRGITSTEIIPNIVPILSRLDREREPELLFVAGFNHPPNRDAVHWFRAEVWESVRERVPDARWKIAGSNTPADVSALHGTDGIDVLGFVPSTVPLLDSAQVSIAPLTYGGGMKGKVSEAMAAGVPVVTTRWGAQGFEAGNNSAFLVRDSPEGFADAVVGLLQSHSDRANLSRAGQQFAKRVCTISAAEPALDRLIAASAQRGPKRPMVYRYFAMSALVARFILKRAVSRTAH